MEISQKFSIDLDSISTKEKTYLTHNFHPYPAKFIPQIPREIINYLNVNSGTILDPFCGSGTTLVESSLLGFKAIGIDSNPIAVLASKVKSTSLNIEQISLIESFLMFLETLKLQINYNLSEESLPDFKNRDHWFQRNMLIELLSIKKEISNINDSDVKDFLYLALSSIVVRCSNQDSDTRWVAKQKNLEDGYAIEYFIKKSSDMLSRIIEFSKKNKGKSFVYKKDSRELDFLQNNSVDLVITSPPYLNSYDYYLYHKLRMFILGFDHKSAQNLEIGSRNKHNDKKQSAETYFNSIKSVFSEVYRVLKPNGYCCVVVGDSIVKSNLIKMDEEYKKIFNEIGYQFKECFSYNQRKYTNTFTRNFKTQYKNSHIIFFKKIK